MLITVFLIQKLCMSHDLSSPQSSFPPTMPSLLEVVSTTSVWPLKRTQSRSSKLKQMQLGSSKLKRTQSGNSSGSRCSRGAAVKLRETNARQRHYRKGPGCWRVSIAVPDSCRRGEGGETSEAYPCLQQKGNCRVPCCANTNRCESSSNLCIVKSCRCRTAHIGEQRTVWN